MKNLIRISGKLASLVLVILAIPAVGGGTGGNQGPRFAGQGLDKTVDVIGGGYQSTGIQVYSLNLPSPGFPAPPTIFGSTGSAISPSTSEFNYELSNIECTRDANNVKLAWCTATVKSKITDRRPCGQPLNSNGTSNLMAINAGWDSSKPALDFSVNTQVVFACKDPGGADGGEDREDVVGAFGKCVRFGFYDRDDSTNPTDPSWRKQFLACIRAVRGDFCSNGVSLTEPGTPFAIHTPPPLQPQEKLPDAGICGSRLGDGGTVDNCWEATWNEDGATCMNHRRYMELLNLAASNVPEVWADVKAGKAKQSPPSHLHLLDPELVVEFEKGPKVYKRPAVGPAERTKTALSASLQTALASQNVLLNCPKPSPVLECLKQFTTYFYDDKHWMWWMVDANPVDSVTAQVVCKPQYYRTEPGAVMTRTSVRFPNQTGSDPKYDVLPCCDTLGDCAP